MKKLINPMVEIDHLGKEHQVYVEIKYIDGKLSLCGVTGPMSNGNAWGGCGQIDDSMRELDAQHRKLSDGWSEAQVKLLLEYWDKYHLNDMHAACEHQSDLGWDKEPIDPSKPLNVYGKFYPGQSMDSWNMKGWVYPPYGHLTEACPICGYKYGTAWLAREVPKYVIDFLFGLPDSPCNMPGSWGKDYRLGWDTLVVKKEVANA